MSLLAMSKLMFVQFCFKRRSQKVSVADSTFYSKIDDTDSQNDYLALSPCVDEIQSSGLNQKLKKKPSAFRGSCGDITDSYQVIPKN